jgi:hypothetical protein
MTSWTKQQGYPVVSVKLNNQNLEFDQVPLQLASDLFVSSLRLSSERKTIICIVTCDPCMFIGSHNSCQVVLKGKAIGLSL